MMDSERKQLMADLKAINKQLKPLLAEQNRIESRLLGMKLEQYANKIGLRTGDELALTPEFIEFDRHRGNDPDFYCRDGRKLKVDIIYESSIKRGVLGVTDGHVGVGGVPIDMVKRMRKAALKATE